MGCTGSKLVAAEPTSPDKAFPGDAPRQRSRQARLSLAGNFKQFESTPSATYSMEPSGDSRTLEPATPTGLRVHYAYLTQRGHYPDQPNKANQDAVMVLESFAGSETQHLMGVLDGHGETGAECAQFAKAKFPSILENEPELATHPNRALQHAMVATNAALHASPIDDTLSGTTACIGLLKQDRLYIANVGDSRAVLATAMPSTPTSPRSPTLSARLQNSLPNARDLVAVDLTTDQTPFREDECARVTKAGSRVLTLDQVEGLKDPGVKCWTNEASCDGDPPRLWAPAGTYPGTAFTRSIGDSVAESIGVIADPELTSVRITKEHAFLILASDGIWEFLPSQKAVDIVAGCGHPEDAAKALVSAAYKAWLQKEMRTDDISVVVAFFSFGEPDAAPETA